MLAKKYFPWTCLFLSQEKPATFPKRCTLSKAANRTDDFAGENTRHNFTWALSTNQRSAISLQTRTSNRVQQITLPFCPPPEWRDQLKGAFNNS